MDNRDVIIALCSHLSVGTNVRPLDSSEWSKLADKLIELKLEPKNLANFTLDDYQNKFSYPIEFGNRLKLLFERNASLLFEISRYKNMGINIVSRADANYPKKLKSILKGACPPLFYYVGDLGLLQDDLIAVIGSKVANSKDEVFCKTLVGNIISKKYSVVSGGTKGINSIAVDEALSLGGVAVEFVAVSLISVLKDPVKNKAIRDGRLLVLSHTKPDAGFNVDLSLSENKFIYASSVATVVIKSDYNKGGTWTGAVDNLRNKYTPLYCWNNSKYLGNQELIKNGAIPIEEDWNVSITGNDTINSNESSKQEKYVNISIFDKDL